MAEVEVCVVAWLAWAVVAGLLRWFVVGRGLIWIHLGMFWKSRFGSFLTILRKIDPQLKRQKSVDTAPPYNRRSRLKKS